MWQAQALPVAVPVGLCMPGLAHGARAGKREWVQPGQHSAQHVSRQIIPVAGLRAGAAAVFFPLRLCCRMKLGLVGPLHLLSLGLGQRLAGRCDQPLACRLVACQPAAHGGGDLLTTVPASFMPSRQLVHAPVTAGDGCDSVLEQKLLHCLADFVLCVCLQDGV